MYDLTPILTQVSSWLDEALDLIDISTAFGAIWVVSMGSLIILMIMNRLANIIPRR